MPLTDGEIRDQLHRSLKKQGLEFHLEHKVTGAEKSGDQIVVKATGKKGDVQFTGDKVLAAVGRRPYTAGLGLKEAGVVVKDAAAACKWMRVSRRARPVFTPSAI